LASTLAKLLFSQRYSSSGAPTSGREEADRREKIPSNKALVSHLDIVSPQRAVALLCDVCLVDRAALLRPFQMCASSEQQRAEIALALARAETRALADGGAGPPVVVVLDEFTSKMDRALARRLSESLAGYARGAHGGAVSLVLAGVFEDVVPWLACDWVLHSGSGEVSVQCGTAGRGRSVFPVPRGKKSPVRSGAAACSSQSPAASPRPFASPPARTPAGPGGPWSAVRAAARTDLALACSGAKSAAELAHLFRAPAIEIDVYGLGKHGERHGYKTVFEQKFEDRW
jgi:hypothetical protein